MIFKEFPYMVMSVLMTYVLKYFHEVGIDFLMVAEYMEFSLFEHDIGLIL